MFPCDFYWEVHVYHLWLISSKDFVQNLKMLAFFYEGQITISSHACMGLKILYDTLYLYMRSSIYIYIAYRSDNPCRELEATNSNLGKGY